MRWGERADLVSGVNETAPKNESPDASAVAAREKKRMERGPDADTLRKRAMHDARGKVLREGVTFRGDAPLDSWAVVRSVKGRVTQCDCVLNGEVVLTCSLPRATRWVKSL